LLRDKIVALDHYYPPQGKTKGTRSTPYSSTRKKLPSLAYFTTTTQVVSEVIQKGKEEGKRVLLQNPPIIFIS
jgi:hypothetical protein